MGGSRRQCIFAGKSLFASAHDSRGPPTKPETRDAAALNKPMHFRLIMVSHLSTFFLVAKSSNPAFVGSRFGCRRPFAYIHHRHLRGVSSQNKWRPLISQDSKQKLLRNTLFSTRLLTSDNETVTSEPEPFTWPQLIQLFRSPNQHNHFVPSDDPKLSLFRRSRAVQSTYLDHQRYLKLNWRSAYDYLCVNKFGKEFGFECSEMKRSTSDDLIDVAEPRPNCQYIAVPSLKQALEHAIENKLKYLSLVPNEYPYDVDDGINHYCLWKIGGTSIGEGILEDELNWAITELKKCPKKDFYKSSLIVNHDCVEHYATIHTGYWHGQHDVVDYLYWVNPPHLQSMPEIQHAHILVLRRDGDDKENIHIGNEFNNSLSNQLS